MISVKKTTEWGCTYNLERVLEFPPKKSRRVQNICEQYLEKSKAQFLVLGQINIEQNGSLGVFKIYIDVIQIGRRPKKRCNDLVLSKKSETLSESEMK